MEDNCRGYIKSIADYYIVETIAEKILKVSQTITWYIETTAEKILKV